MNKLPFIYTLFAWYIQVESQVYHQPEQIHLAYGECSNDIVVTWTTFSKTPESIVEYGIGGLLFQEFGEAILFDDNGEMKTPQYIHKVVLNGLNYNSRYIYHCGSKLGWSEEFWFMTPPPNEMWQPHLAIYGDMGNTNPQSLPRLQQETQRGLYNAILHLGDIAYDLNEREGMVGDEFLRQIQSIAAYLPYMTCVGNHEASNNFSHYKARFNMPGDTMYSLNLGPLHIIFISTEVYYYLLFGIKPLVFQYRWLEEDLRVANLPENRQRHPWIIVVGHRPMYCSDNDGDDCSYPDTITRIGLPFFHSFGLEELFFNHGVDLEIWAHEHSYERLWPVYDHKVYNGSYERPYVNPRAPVHIITGSAGCRERVDDFLPMVADWSAFRSSDYGYMRLKAVNKTHLYLEQVSDDKAGAVIDSLWIVKDYHGPYRK